MKKNLGKNFEMAFWYEKWLNVYYNIYYTYNVSMEFRIFLICEKIKHKMWVKNFSGAAASG